MLQKLSRPSLSTLVRQPVTFCKVLQQGNISPRKSASGKSTGVIRLRSAFLEQADYVQQDHSANRGSQQGTEQSA
jgi:hypothetical protein